MRKVFLKSKFVHTVTRTQVTPNKPWGHIFFDVVMGDMTPNPKQESKH